MKFWANNQIVESEAVSIHPLSTALKYGAGVFEGLRGYWNAEQEQLHIFRLDEHLRRLQDSAKILRFTPMPTSAELAAGTKDVLKADNIATDVHIRIQVFVDEVGGFIDARGPVKVFISAVPMGRHNEGAGKHIAVSSWRRITDSTMPPRIKSVANYENSRLALLEAQRHGYDDAVLLTADGHVSEGPGYNVFVRRGNQLITPSVTDGILEGVTRDSIITLARMLDIEVVERSIDRTELYVADEVFFVGTAGEVTPILSVDQIDVGEGHTGELTQKLREVYLEVARNEREDTFGWLTTINNGKGE
jgi:branched-chain amino acid aminotransferase